MNFCEFFQTVLPLSFFLFLRLQNESRHSRKQFVLSIQTTKETFTHKKFIVINTFSLQQHSNITYYCIIKLHLLNGLHKQSIEMQEQSRFYLEQHRQKRTSGVSHDKNSNTYKSSNRSVPSDSQTRSIKNFFTATQPVEEHDELEVRNAFDVSNFKWTYNFVIKND